MFLNAIITVQIHFLLPLRHGLFKFLSQTNPKFFFCFFVFYYLWRGTPRVYKRTCQSAESLAAGLDTESGEATGRRKKRRGRGACSDAGGERARVKEGHVDWQLAVNKTSTSSK
jgi:hypothetical protein